MQRSNYGWFTSGLVTPMTMATLQRGSPAPLLHHLRPLITYESPSRVMLQEMFVASLDATPGSVVTGRKFTSTCPPSVTLTLTHSPLSLTHSSSLSLSLAHSLSLFPLTDGPLSHSCFLSLTAPPSLLSLSLTAPPSLPLTHSPSLSLTVPLSLPLTHSPSLLSLSLTVPPFSPSHSQPLPPFSPSHSQPLPPSLPFTHSASLPLSLSLTAPPSLPLTHSPSLPLFLSLSLTHPVYLTCHAKTGPNLPLQQWFQPLFLLLFTTIQVQYLHVAWRVCVCLGGGEIGGCGGGRVHIGTCSSQ